MADLKDIFSFIPEVRKPEEKKLSFGVKLKWTLLVLVAFFVLANVPLFGLSVSALVIFEALVYVLMQGLQAAAGFTGLLIFQLILGGLAIFYMTSLRQNGVLVLE